MAFRPRRQWRKERLLDRGLLNFEAHGLSKVNLTTVPYFRRFMAIRQGMVTRLKNRGKTSEQIKEYIRDWYRRRGFAFGTMAGAWEAFRHYEYAYRTLNPEYESPWQKRGHRRRDFSQAAARDLRERKAEVSQVTRDWQERMAKERERQFRYIRGEEE